MRCRIRMPNIQEEMTVKAITTRLTIAFPRTYHMPKL